MRRGRAPTRDNRPGAVLLEAIIALAILSISGIALLQLTSESYLAVSVAAAEEFRMRSATRLLDAASLWSRTELDQRLGARVQGEMLMSIARTTATLYHVRLFDRNGGALLLSTTLYRPVRPDA